jgi:hypothetical protein
MLLSENTLHPGSRYDLAGELLPEMVQTLPRRAARANTFNYFPVQK